ncbi:MAG: Gfo/Idh/MocA family oxidoreductase [bacterium]|nr:Gfo/Idh/MocA family oxidoreductase [bacterium]
MKMKWGIIGTGYIAAAFAEAMKVVEEGELAAVASRSLEKANEFKEKYQVNKAFGSYQELMEDDSIDAVYIAIPHSEHAKYAEIAMRHKKHVLCEKPMTINEEETSRLLAVAKEEQVFLMEAMWTKFLPVTKKIRDWIEAGRIGDINFIDARFGFVAEMDPGSRLYNPNLGGGALLDVGIYPIMYALYLVKEQLEGISSFVKKAETGVDELNMVQLIFKNGAIASLASSICSEIGTDAIIMGTKGKLVIPDFYKAETALLYDLNGNLMDQIEEPFEGNGYEYEIREAISCIRENRMESKLHPLESTRELMGMLDAIREQWGLTYPGGR